VRHRRRRSKLLPLGELLPRVYPEADQAIVLKVFGWWSRAVPQRVLRNARPVRLKNGVLIVHTATSAWASELDLLKDKLLGSLRRTLPEADVRDMRFRVGPLPDVAKHQRAAKPAPVVPVQELPEEVARALAAVHDDELRHVVANAAGVSLGRDRERPPRKRRPGGQR